MHEPGRIVDMSAALNEAIHEEMERDAAVFIYGENITLGGGRYGVTSGLSESFGGERVMDTPLNEELFVGIALGAAQAGMRPIVEFLYANFLHIAASDIMLAGLWRFKSSGRVSAPLVVRAVISNRKASSMDLLGDPSASFMSLPGIKIVVPSSPYNAKGLLKSAIRDNNPVLFFEHDNLYGEKEEIPIDEYLVPLGKARVMSAGSNATVVSYGYCACLIERELKQYCLGAGVEVIDLLSLKPLDIDTISMSVGKTKKLLIVEEGGIIGGVGSEVLSLVHEHHPDVRIKRLGAKDMPIPIGTLSGNALPTSASIRAALDDLLSGNA